MDKKAFQEMLKELAELGHKMNETDLGLLATCIMITLKALRNGGPEPVLLATVLAGFVKAVASGEATLASITGELDELLAQAKSLHLN